MRVLLLFRGAPGCVDCDTEYFNGYEWKKISEYKEGDKVLQFNNDRSAELVFPVSYIKNKQEYLYGIHTQTVDQVLSLNHDFVYETNKGNNLAKRKVSEIINLFNNNKYGFRGKILNSFNINDNAVHIDEYKLRLMIAISADGSIAKSKKYWRIRLKKQRKIIRLKWLLDRNNINYEEKIYADGYYNFNVPVEFGIKEFPHEWYFLDKKSREVFKDEIFKWDGYEKEMVYSTTIKNNADIAQFILSQFGKRVSIYIDNRICGIHKHICYNVRLTSESYTHISKKNRNVLDPMFIKEKTKDGYEYCFSVPSGMLVLRRNNKIFITGNCGKSTFIKEHNLEKYALSSDGIRLKIQSPVLSADGKEIVTQKNDKEAWSLLFNIFQKRMEKGEFTVIDATNSKTSEINRYKEFADKYKYRIYIVDMTDLSIEECKRRNAARLPEYKRVPDNVIDKMYARFETQKVPSGIKVIKPDEFDEILYRPIDLSQYKKIHVIGDLHSCYTALHEYLGNELKEDEYYIFVGDYLDRGIEPVETLKFLLSIYNLPNVILLEGNHETYLYRYSNGIEDYSRNFKETTFPYLNKAVSAGEIKKKDLKQLYRRFNQICYFTYGEKKVLVSHGGVSGMKENLIYVSTEQLIRGVGEYEDYLKCAKAFEENTDENTYQINGHRNVEKCEVHATDRCFNLEGGVEHGGFLRVVTLDENGFETHEIKNNVFREKETVEVELPKEVLTNEDIVRSLRSNKYVKEKVMGNISSFNFTREAFREGVWNEQTTRARGLFIDNRTNEIVTRGYNKWFKVNEVENTKITNLKNTLKFPVTVYVKENGFLGLISYNKDTDDLMFATKSVVDYAAQEDDMVNMFKNMYLSLASEEQKKNLLDYLRVNNKTIACECIHKQKDPHIIEYDSNRIYLLDIITNDFEGKKEPYEVLQTAANSFGMMCKEKAFTFDSWEDLYGWYIEATEENYKYNGRYVEGFVVEDSIWSMFKIKTAYYNMWKMLRGITPAVIKKGYINKTSNLYNAVSNYYYGWLRDHRDEYIKIDENGKKIIDDVNIIDLRKKFEVDMAAKNNG